MDTHIGRFYFFGIFQNVEMWRTYFRIIVIVGFSLWFVLGFDSVIEQIYPFINNFIPIIMGQISIESVISLMQESYGKGSHFSAVVIYGVSWLMLSGYLDFIGIKRSYNFFMSMMLTLLNMGIFEIAWNSCCAFYQNLPWLMLQTSNIPQYYAWIGMGSLAIIYLHLDGYRFNLSKHTYILIFLSLATWLFWIYYPLPIKQIYVITTEGMWTSSLNFPQTLYTVDPDPTDNIYKGIFYFVENNMIHFTNIMAKIFTTFALIKLFEFRKVKQ